MLSSKEFQSLTKMSSTVYQIRFYTDDVVAIYLKPITSVPGDAFADQLRSSSFLGFPSGFKAVSMLFFILV